MFPPEEILIEFLPCTRRERVLTGETRPPPRKHFHGEKTRKANTRLDEERTRITWSKSKLIEPIGCLLFYDLLIIPG